MMYTDSSRGANIAKDPAVVHFQGKYFMYYSVSPGTNQNMSGWDIGIAVSEDMESWEKIGELARVGNAEKNGICAPAAILINGIVHLFYQNYGNFPKDAICHAYSKDGVHFEHDSSNPIFNPTGDWNNGRAIDADMVFWGGYLYLYFATRDPQGKVQMLGVARAKEGSDYARSDWEQCCDETILRPDLAWEQLCIEAPAALVKNGRIYMFYAGAYNNYPQQVGVATSTDGIHFTRMFDTPFMANGAQGEWNHSESGHPYIFEDDDGRVYLFYQGNKDNGKSWYLSKREIRFEGDLPVLI